MTPSVVVPGMSMVTTGTPPSCPGVVTTSAGTGMAVIICSNSGRCSSGAPAGAIGEAGSMVFLAAAGSWLCHSFSASRPGGRGFIVINSLMYVKRLIQGIDYYLGLD